MITAIVILSGLALFQLFLNIFFIHAFRMTLRELEEQTKEIVPINLDDE